MMISNFAIRRPIVTVVTMLAIAVFGLAALVRLQTDEYPDVQVPAVGVMIAYPGASPEGVEREVLSPLEDRLTSLAGVEKVESSVYDGALQMVVYFRFGRDVQAASQDVRDAIAGIRGDLPAEMQEPSIVRFDPADQPVLSLALASPGLDAAKLTRLADPGITRELQAIPGVAQVTLFGDVERELTVELDPRAMTAASVGVQDVMTALRLQNLATWQWTMRIDDGEPLVAAEAVTTRRRVWREQAGGGYYQGRTFVPEPIYIVEHHVVRGVVRFGPPRPEARRSIALRAYPPGVPAVLRVRWKLARSRDGA